MLKFTKYGRTTSTGTLPISSQKDKAKPAKPSVVLTSFKNVSLTSTKISDEKSQLQIPNAAVPDGTSNTSKSLTIGPNMHLQRSKVSKEELIEMDSKFNELNETMSGVATNKYCCNNKFKSVDVGKIDKESSRKCNSLRPGSMRGFVSIYNDGYFPKVQPLSKLFTMKRSKSKLSRNAPGSTLTHG